MAFQRPGHVGLHRRVRRQPGIQATLHARSTTNSTLPILLRNNPTLPAAPRRRYPMAPTSITTSVNVFDTNLQMPYTQSWSVGWQRKLTRDSAFEFRYVGSRHGKDWDTININETEHHDQRLPQRVPAGAGQPAGQHRRRPRRDVRVHRRRSGTTPLPIFLAHFNGQNAANAGNAAAYCGRQLDQRDDSSASSPRAIRIRSASCATTPAGCRRRAGQRLPATRRSATTRRPPACRSTSSSPTPTCSAAART